MLQTELRQLFLIIYIGLARLNWEESIFGFNDSTKEGSKWVDAVECYANSIPCLQKDVQSRMVWERVDIDDEFKRFVIGKQGAKLREISIQTGAKVILKDKEVYILLGNEEQRKQARLHIGTIVVGRFLLLVICETSLIASLCSMSIRLFVRSNSCLHLCPQWQQFLQQCN